MTERIKLIDEEFNIEIKEDDYGEQYDWLEIRTRNGQDVNKLLKQILKNQEKLEKIEDGLTNGMYDQQAYRYISKILKEN